jgi:hypothetical protein
MSDAGSDQAVPPATPAHPPFPVVRLLYSFGFAILAWLVFWAILILAAVQFVAVAINGKVHDELKAFSLGLIQYLWELMAFVTFVRDEQPFPLGPLSQSCLQACVILDHFDIDII